MRLNSLLIIVLISVVPMDVFGQSSRADSSDIHSLLITFLDGASWHNLSVHERMWSENLIYTSSNGTRRGKSEIIEGIKQAGATDPATGFRYSAEDVLMLFFDEFVIVAFRLIAVPASGETQYYLNTGTFTKENGEWKAVSWNATAAAK